jgi:hypothetical protein
MQTTRFDIRFPSTPLGFVEMALGAVFAVRAGGERFLLSRGDPIYRDDVLETGSGGAACVAVASRGRVLLGAGKRVAVDQLAPPATL